MSTSTKRLERIERVYWQVIGDRFPETVPDSVWRPAVLAVVPDCTTEDLIAMFNRMTQKYKRAWREFQKRPRLCQAPNWPDWLKSPRDVSESVDDTAAAQ